MQIWKFHYVFGFIIIIIQELQIRRQISASMNRSCSQNFIGKFFHASSNLFLNDRSEVKENCVEFSHTIFVCFPYQLAVVFSTRTVSKSEVSR